MQAAAASPPEPGSQPGGDGPHVPPAPVHPRRPKPTLLDKMLADIRSKHAAEQQHGQQETQQHAQQQQQQAIQQHAAEPQAPLAALKPARSPPGGLPALPSPPAAAGARGKQKKQLQQQQAPSAARGQLVFTKVQHGAHPAATSPAPAPLNLSLFDSLFSGDEAAAQQQQGQQGQQGQAAQALNLSLFDSLFNQADGAAQPQPAQQQGWPGEALLPGWQQQGRDGQGSPSSGAGTPEAERQQAAASQQASPAGSPGSAAAGSGSGGGREENWVEFPAELADGRVPGRKFDLSLLRQRRQQPPPQQFTPPGAQGSWQRQGAGGHGAYAQPPARGLLGAPGQVPAALHQQQQWGSPAAAFQQQQPPWQQPWQQQQQWSPPAAAFQQPWQQPSLQRPQQQQTMPSPQQQSLQHPQQWQHQSPASPPAYANRQASPSSRAEQEASPAAAEQGPGILEEEAGTPATRTAEAAAAQAASAQTDTLGSAASSRAEGQARPSSAPSSSAGEWPTHLTAYLSGRLAAAVSSEERGKHRIVELFPWQAECLNLPGVQPQKGRVPANLVYTAPTGSGKSAVAHILILRALHTHKDRKAMLIEPLRKACEEQVAALTPLVALLGKEVKGSFGGGYSQGPLSRHCGVLVCTPENAQNIINRLMDTGVNPASEFSIIVADEIHHVEDESRGLLYELLCAKLRYVQATAQARLHEAAAEWQRLREERAQQEGERQGERQQQEENRVQGEHQPMEVDEEGEQQGGDESQQLQLAGNAGHAEVDPREHLQLVAMSATLPGAEAIGRWLGCRPFRGGYRPVELKHFLLREDGSILDAQQGWVRKLRRLPQDPVGVLSLVQEAADSAQQSLVFCATKAGAEAEAEHLAQHLRVPQALAGRNGAHSSEPADGGAGGGSAGQGEGAGPAAGSHALSDSRAAVAAKLRELGGPLEVKLAGLVERGAAFYHAEVSREAQQLVIGAYQAGKIAVLCSTTSLKSSVNLSTFRVIFRNAYVAINKQANWLTPTDYHQMAGRAGRVGHEQAGESFLVHVSKERPPMDHLLSLLRSEAGTMSAIVRSRLAADEFAGLRTALLEAVAGCGARTGRDLARYLHCLLAFASTAAPHDDKLPPDLLQAANDALRWLQRPTLPWRPRQGPTKALGLIRVREERYEPTDLGRAVFASALGVDVALLLFEDLHRANRCLRLDNDMHLAFLSVPPFDTMELQRHHWLHLKGRLDELQERMGWQDEEELRRFLGSLGLSLDYLARRITEAQKLPPNQRSVSKPSAAESQWQERLCSRLFLGLVLEALIAEVPLKEVAKQFGMTDGGVIDLREKSDRCAARCAAFAGRAGRQYSYLRAALKEFQRSVRVGSKMEVMSLRDLGEEVMDLPTARLLFTMGLTSLQDVADAGEEAVLQALCKGGPAKRVSEAKLLELRRQQARAIHTAASKLAADPLQGLREEAADGRWGLPGWMLRGEAARPASRGRGRPRIGQSKRRRGEQQEQEEQEGGWQWQHGQQEGGQWEQGQQEGGQWQQAQQWQQQPRDQPAPWQQRQQWRSEPWPQDGQQPQDSQQPHQEEEEEEEAQVPANGTADEPPASKRARLEGPGAELSLTQDLLDMIPSQLVRKHMGQGSRAGQGGRAEQQPHAGASNGERQAAGSAAAGAGAAAAGGTAAGGAAATGGSVVPGLPGRGLHVVRDLEEVQALCSALAAASCPVGFVLHLSPGRSDTKLPTPGKKQQKGKKQQGQRGQQATGAAEGEEAGGRLLGVALSWQDGTAAYIPLAPGAPSSSSAGSSSSGGTVSSHNQAAFSSPAAKAVAALLKGGGSSSGAGFAWRVSIGLQQQSAALQGLLSCPAFLPGGLADARLAAWACCPDRSSYKAVASVPQEQLELAAERLLQLCPRGEAPWAGLAGASAAAAAAGAGAGAPLEPGWQAACLVAAAALASWGWVQPELLRHGLVDAFVRQEMLVVPVLARMQAVGIGIDLQHLASVSAQLRQRLEEIQGEVSACIRDNNKQPIDLNSPAQVARLLYQDFSLAPAPGAPPLTSGRHSARKELLKRLRLQTPDDHPAMPLLLLIPEHRSLQKKLAFLQNLWAGVKRPSGDGALQPGVGSGPRIHAPLLQTNTDTGRLVMEDNSLQCTPKDNELRRLLPAGDARAVAAAAALAAGEALTQRGNHRVTSANIRATLAAAPGCAMLGADYRQVELRLMAHFSGDAALCEMLQNGGPDPFNLLAAQWLNKPQHQVTRKDRDHVKQLSYAVMYGMGLNQLGEDLGVEPREASRLKDDFFRAYPGVRAYTQRALDDCRKTGYVEMLSGRKRWLPDINSRKKHAKAAAERAAINSIMQGSAADVCKRAMVAIHQRLAALGPGAAALVLQIHDELLLEVEESRVDEVARLVRECMEGAWPAPLRVPLPVRLSVGPSWGELREMRPGGPGGAAGGEAGGDGGLEGGDSDSDDEVGLFGCGEQFEEEEGEEEEEEGESGGDEEG